MSIESKIINALKRPISVRRLAELYAPLCRRIAPFPEDVSAINAAIIRRYSNGRLQSVKKMAWKIAEATR